MSRWNRAARVRKRRKWGENMGDPNNKTQNLGPWLARRAARKRRRSA